MTTPPGRVRRVTVYHRCGETLSQTCEPPDAREGDRPRQRTVSDSVSLRQIMSTQLICARRDLQVAAVVELMVRHHVGCIPVVDDRRRPIGVITKFDLVEQIDAAMRASATGPALPENLRAETAEEVMMPLALTLPEHATVAHAASMMTSEDTHHVLVVSDTGTLIGVVSTSDIVGWLVENDGLFSGRDTPVAATTRSVVDEERS